MLIVTGLIQGRGWTHLYYAPGGAAHEGHGCDQSIDLPSLKPLSVAGCGLQQLGVPHLAASVNYCK